MREIKFRWWSSEYKCWEEPAGFDENLNPQWWDIDSQILMDYGSDLIPMQYTGLKDKNGKEIYEGDIVTCGSPRRCPHEVVWMERVPAENFVGSGMPGFYLSGMNAGYDFIGSEEVIGNIYENPELLDMEDRNDDSAREELANDNDGEGVLIEEAK